MATTQMQLRICKLTDGGLVWNLWHSLQVIGQVCSLAADSMSKHATNNRTACPVQDKDSSKTA